jgi:TolR protein
MSFGRLKAKRSDAPMSDINMTPLIDVMLVLLVIFIITAPMMLSAVKVDLPKADAAANSQSDAQPLAVTIDQSGVIYVQEQRLQGEALRQALRQAAQRNPTTEVQLRADTAVPYGRVVEFMALANAAGLSRIGFVTEKPQ